jgi:exosome complex component RRP42
MTQINVLKELESAKVLEKLKEGKRLDDRKLDEYRSIQVANNVSENANGSARVKLGETEVIAGTKFVIGVPYPDSPNEGSIAFGAELTPLASPNFEVGPPRAPEIELARVVDRAVRESHCVDLKSLCIEEGEKSLILFVDIYAINDDGNLLDASSMAALSALNTTRLPKIEDGKIIYTEYDGMLKMAAQPLLSTVVKAGGQIFADATASEEKAMHARFSFGSTEKGILTAFQKGGPGSFTMSELEKAVEMGLQNTKKIRKLLKV